MEVMVFESAAFYALINQVTKPLLDEIRQIRKEYWGQSTENIFMDEDEVMKLLRITSRSWLSEYRVKNDLPCHKVGRKYVYKRAEIMNYIEEHKANK